MNRTFAATAVAAAALAVSGCGISGIPLDGDTSTEVRSVDTFESIELKGAAEVVVVVGGRQTVEVVADTAVQKYVKTTVSDGELVIDTDYGWRWGDIDVDIRISVPSLDSFDLKGAGNIVIRGIDSDTFAFSLTGAGDVNIAGTAEDVTIKLAGAGGIDAYDLIAEDVVARLSGAGQISVTATDTLDATLSGVGSIDYDGDPAVTSKISGVGSIDPQ